MRKALVICTLVLIYTGITSAVQWNALNNADEPFTVNSVKNYEGTELTYSVNGYALESVLIDGKNYSLFTKLELESLIEEKGYPQLPRINRSIIVPDNGVMGFKVLSSDYIEIDNVDIAPSKGTLTRDIDPAKVPFEFGKVYSKDAFYPENLVEMTEPFIVRDLRGVTVMLNAFRYNPVQKKLRIYTDVKIEVVKTVSGGVNIIQRNEPLKVMNRQFSEIYKRMFVNYNPMDYPTLLEEGSMLVICYDSFMPAMEPFVEWKNQKGLPTEMVAISTIGNNYTAIKNYITNYYNTNDLGYVLIVGDAAQVATYSSGSSDPMYSLITGNDNWPEIFVGRFSAENVAHVNTQVLRTVNYEKFPDAGAAWYHQGLGIASNQGPGHYGEYDDEHITLIGGKLLRFNYTMVDSCYDPWGTQAMITRSLEVDGISTINYCGHGSTTSWGTTGYSNTQVNALVNTHLPTILSVACNNGTFTTTTCFAEAWLRSVNESTGEPAGAVATYMSRISQSWNPPMDAQDEAVDVECDTSMFTWGGMCFNGSMRMIELTPGTGATEFKAWTIFGDPSLMVRNDTPTSVTAVTPNLNVGLSSYTVTVTAGASALQGALVCAQNDEVYAVGYTDANGQAHLTFNPAPVTPGILTVTVTGWNLIPAIQEANIIVPTGPYVIVNNVDINDPSGNNNGFLNPGETVTLSIALENIGVENALGVEAVISSSDQYVTILDNNQNYGNINIGSVITIDDGFQIAYSSTAPAIHSISFTISLTSASGNWQSNFTLEGVPSAAITLTPTATPIQIPAAGGSFQFEADIVNNAASQITTDIWTMMTYPDGTQSGPFINVSNKTLNSGVHIIRTRTQNVPGTAPAGDYTYDAYLGDYPDVLYAEYHLPFTKLGVDLNSFNTGWENYGESFDEPLAADAITPAGFGLLSAYPNPFNPSTSIAFAIAETGKISLTVYNLNGQQVAELYEGFLSAGNHSFNWNAAGNASGIYFIRLNGEGFEDISKVILMK